MADEKKTDEENGERPRGASEYAKKEGSRPRPRPKTRFVFKFAALIIILLAAWIGWILYRSGGDPRDLLSEEKRAALYDKMTDDYRKAVNASDDARNWAEKEFKDWNRVLTERLKTPPPKTKKESSALVKETEKELKKPTPPPVESKPTGSMEKKTAPAGKPKSNPALTKAMEEYGHGMKAYAMTDPMASQAQVQKYVRLAAGHFEVCLYWLDKARSDGVSENLIDHYEQPATKRLYDCRKRMELQLR